MKKIEALINLQNNLLANITGRFNEAWVESCEQAFQMHLSLDYNDCSDEQMLIADENNERLIDHYEMI